MKKNLRESAFIALAILVISIRTTVAADPATTSSSTPVTTSSSTPATTSSSSTTEATPSDSATTTDSWDGVRTVVVTATKQETDPAKTGTSISVVSSEQIEREQYRTMADALSQVPGVTVTSTGTPGQTTYFTIRGAKTADNSYLLDGRRLPFELGGTADIENLLMANVDQIEVARGPSSSVAGGAAIGGVINIITRDGRGQGTPKTEAFFETGSYNTFREGVTSWGSEGKFDYSSGVVRMDTDNQRDNNQYRNIGTLNKLGYEITPDLYFDTRILYSSADMGSPNTIDNFDPSANFLREMWGVSPGLTWKTTEIWTQSVYYGRYQYRQVASSYPYPYVYPSGYTDYGSYNNRVQCDTDQVNYQSHVQVFDNWGLTAGFDGNNLSYYRRINQDEFAGNGQFYPAGSKDVDDGQTNTGYSLESQWEILEGWNFITNGRFDHYSDFGDAATYRAAMSYEIPEVKTVLHSNYGTSYAPPTPLDIAGSFYSVPPDLKPEKSKGYEFGISQPFLGKKLNVFGTWFHNDITNRIQYVYDPATYQYTMENVSKAYTEGVETGFTIDPVKQVHITVSYTNLTAIGKADELTNFNYHLTNSPRHTVNASVSYKPIDPLCFTVSGSYVADRTSGYDVNMENYLNMRFTASYQVNSYLQVFGRIENLTNDQYQQIYGYPALDQSFYGGFKVTF